MDHPLIIKVKCKGILRRIRAYVSKDGILNLDLNALRKKVGFLFQISADVDFKLRYIDEDGDEITLFENSDLCEAIAQCLNPLWINVALKNTYEKGCESSSTLCSSPNESAQDENLSSFVDYAKAGVLKLTEGILGGILLKITHELVERSACLVLSELVECMSKIVISSPDVVSKHQDRENISLTSTAASTLVNSFSRSNFSKIESPQPVLTEYPDLDKCCESRTVENPTFKETAADKLNLSITGDCPENSTVPTALVRDLFGSRFVFDLNDEDFTLVALSTTFSKKLKLCNSGLRAWPHKSKLVWIGGDQLTDDISVETEIPVDGLPVGEELDVLLNVKALELPGYYTSYWKMSLPTGEIFGQRIWVDVQVYDPLEELDLDCSPLGRIEGDDKARYTTAKSIDVGCSKVSVEAKKSFPTLITRQTKDKTKNTGSQLSNLCTKFRASSTSRLVAEPCSGSSGAHVKSISAAEDNDLECSLLKVLDEMGFRLANLNKEILRLNSYDLQQTVTDLFGFSEWDQVFTELENTASVPLT